MEIQNISWIYVWGRKIDIYLAHRLHKHGMEHCRKISESESNECIELGDSNDLLHNL